MRVTRGADGVTRHVPAPIAPAPTKGKKQRFVPDPIIANENTQVGGEQLKLFIERIERLEEEKQGIVDDIKDVYGEAKSTGFDVKAMRDIIRIRKMEKHHRDEAEHILETYKMALNL